jgi:hypothetical protein
MRPLFTLHAGEFLVGEYIERTFPSLNVWVPAKDTGVDLLITDESAQMSLFRLSYLAITSSQRHWMTSSGRCLPPAGWS